jgi:four helix bundle protein
MLHSYRELKVWQRSIELVVEIYRLTSLLPKTELYGLTSQMRRCVVSVSSNIAEGYARKHRAEYVQFLRISFGSGAEIETQLEIVRVLKFANEKELERSLCLLDEVMRMLNKMIENLVEK